MGTGSSCLSRTERESMNGPGDGAPLLRFQIHNVADHGMGYTVAFGLQHVYSRFAAFLTSGK